MDFTIHGWCFLTCTRSVSVGTRCVVVPSLRLSHCVNMIDLIFGRHYCFMFMVYQQKIQIILTLQRRIHVSWVLHFMACTRVESWHVEGRHLCVVYQHSLSERVIFYWNDHSMIVSEHQKLVVRCRLGVQYMCCMDGLDIQA